MFDAPKLYPAIEAWLEELAKPYLHFLREEHDALLARNRALTGNSCYAVGGDIYGPGGVRPPRLEGRLAPLPAQLLPAHTAWQANQRRHDEEWRLACQLLRSLVGKAKNWQDIRDMIPDPVLRPFPATGLMELTRSRPDLYAGQPQESNYPAAREEREAYWDPKLLDTYEQIGELVNLYVSYRLL